MSRHCPVGGFARAFADHDLGADELLAASTRPGPGHAQRPPGPQARGQLAAQRAAALDVERLIDRLVREPHRVIIREVHRESVGDLLRTPRGGPAAVPAASVTPPDPAHLRTGHQSAVRGGDHTSQPILHVLAQRRIGGQLGGLRAPSTALGMPLSRRSPILQRAATGSGVPAQLPRDRRRRPAHLPGDLTHAAAPGLQDRDLLALGERQVASRQRSPADRRHSATLTKPPDADRGRHTGSHARLLTRHPGGDRRPEPLPILPPTDDPANASAPAPPDQTDAAVTFPSQLLTVEALQRLLESARYTSIDYAQTLADHGVLASVGSVGDAYDNALAESFVDSFKTALIADRVWRTRTQLELAVVEYVGWSTTAACTKLSATSRPPSSSNYTPRRPRFRATDRSRCSHRGPQNASTRPGLSAIAPATRKQHSQPARTGGRLRRHHSLDRRKPTHPVSAKLRTMV